MPALANLAAAVTAFQGQAIDDERQQAAFDDIRNGTAAARYLAALARVGTEVEAASLAQVTTSSAFLWERSSPEFRAAVADAKAMYTSRLARRGLVALEAASDRDLLMHPNLYFHEMQYREPGRRTTGPLVAIDNRSITLNLPPAQAAAIAGALFGSVPSDTEVGLPALEPPQP